jgi:hypothetical protein
MCSIHNRPPFTARRADTSVDRPHDSLVQGAREHLPNRHVADRLKAKAVLIGLHHRLKQFPRVCGAHHMIILRASYTRIAEELGLGNKAKYGMNVP